MNRRTIISHQLMASASNTFPMQEQSGSTNSSDSKRKRIQRDRARRTSETVAQKEERLRKCRVRDGAKELRKPKIREQPGLQGSVPTRVKGYRWRLKSRGRPDLQGSVPTRVNHPINNSVRAFLRLRLFEIVELSLASHLHIELTPSLFDEKTQEVLGTVN